MAEIFQQDLASIGVKLDIQKVQTAEFTPRLQKGQFGGAWIAAMRFMNLSPATFYASAFPVRGSERLQFRIGTIWGLDRPVVLRDG
jgi:ABC-type transport system substrate-binding protein